MLPVWQVIISKANFIGNTGAGMAGAVYADESALEIAESTFTGNVGGDGYLNDDW